MKSQMARTILILLLYFVANPLAAQVPRGVVAEFNEGKGNLMQVLLAAVESTATTITNDFVLINDRHDTVKGRMRLPRAPSGRFPLAMLVVGLETGKEVVKMIEGYDSVLVVAIDYPFTEPYDFSGLNAFKTVFALHDAGYKTVSQLCLCLEWLQHHPRVDTGDITMIAVSFGIFTALPAAVMEENVHRLVIVQAGGDLSRIIAANAVRLDMPLPAWLAGWLGGWVLAPFEPNRYIGAFAPRPVLIVSGETDALFPQASVQSLYDHANEPKEWIRHRSKHVMPGERELINELTQIVAERLYGER